MWASEDGRITQSGRYTATELGRFRVTASATFRNTERTGTAIADVPLVLTVSVDPKATFLRTILQDTPALPTILDLEAVGVVPGDLLAITYEVPPPGFSFYGCGGPFVDAKRAPVMGVFSGSNTLLKKTALARVPDAIDGGAAYDSSYSVSDIPEDFGIFQGLTIVVPTGASHLFLAMGDSYWGDNCGTINVTIEN